MGVTSSQTGTRIDEVAERIYRISTPFPGVPGGFSFNQYLLADDEPLLFHTGPRTIFPFVREAIASVLPPERLRYVGYSHFESDECGAMPSLLSGAPEAVPLGGRVTAMINGDAFDRPHRALADGETLSLGRLRVRWIDAAHLPHAWECGFLFEETTATLLCGDLFTQGGSDNPPLTTSDILGPSEAFRAPMDYFSHAKDVRSRMAPLVAAKPRTLACMHGSAWQGDGARLLEELAASLDS